MKKLFPLLSLSAVLAWSVAPAAAQDAPPVLNILPTAPPPAPPVAPAAATPTPTVTAPATEVPLVLGQTYQVETTRGTTFTGTLVSMSLTALEFDAWDLGHITLQRDQIKQLTTQGGSQGAPAVGLKTNNYYDIGNGNRLFFGPTARGLRKDEAVFQDVNVLLAGINYGITDNFSMGGYISIVPGLEISRQLLVLTPKLSFKVHEKLHAGAGVLYLRVPGDNGGVGVGLVYGVLTTGSADNNFTVGLGYGFVDNNIGNTPTIQIGGQARISRRISLISENYIIADSRAGMGGLYGLKINWRRASLGLAALYVYTFPYDEDYGYGYTQRQGGNFFSSNGIPLYVDFSLRFGKGAKLN